jgi:hypothetical protein
MFRMQIKKILITAVAIVSGGLLQSHTATALPFNDDMVDSSLTDGQITRAKPDGVIAKGSLEYRVDTREEANKLSNPVKADAKSLVRGSRLYRVNCYTCHGDLESKKWEPGPVGQPGRLPGVPNITDAFYKGKSDGYVYGIIHFGGMAYMPAYGWKLSPTEHWDIINYVRKMQDSK